MCTEIVPGVPYFGTMRGRDKALGCLFEKMDYYLGGATISSELYTEAREVVQEWLDQEVCEGRIEEGALRFELNFIKQDSHMDVRFLPVKPNERFFEAIVGRKPMGDDMHRTWCDTPGEPGHLACGWCTICNKPRFVCGHLIANHPIPSSDDEPWG